LSALDSSGFGSVFDGNLSDFIQLGEVSTNSVMEMFRHVPDSGNSSLINLEFQGA